MAYAKFQSQFQFLRSQSVSILTILVPLLFLISSLVIFNRWLYFDVV